MEKLKLVFLETSVSEVWDKTRLFAFLGTFKLREFRCMEPNQKQSVKTSFCSFNIVDLNCRWLPIGVWWHYYELWGELIKNTVFSIFSLTDWDTEEKQRRGNLQNLFERKSRVDWVVAGRGLNFSTFRHIRPLERWNQTRASTGISLLNSVLLDELPEHHALNSVDVHFRCETNFEYKGETILFSFLTYWANLDSRTIGKSHIDFLEYLLDSKRCHLKILLAEFQAGVFKISEF